MATRKRRTPSGDLYSPHEAYDLVFDTQAEFRWFKRMAAEYPETYGEGTLVGGWLFPSDPTKGRIAEALRAANGRAVDVRKVSSKQRDSDTRTKVYWVGKGNSARQVGPFFRSVKDAEEWARKNINGFYGVYSSKFSDTSNLDFYK